MRTNCTIYQIGFKSILRTVAGPIIVFLILMFVIVGFLVQYELPSNISLIIIIISLFLLCLFVLLPLMLTINYYKNDKKTKLIIDNEAAGIHYIKEGVDCFIPYDQIIILEKIRVSPLFQLSYQSYYYYIIKANGYCIYLSRMLVGKLEKIIDVKCYQESYVAFPIIRNK